MAAVTIGNTQLAPLGICEPSGNTNMATPIVSHMSQSVYDLHAAKQTSTDSDGVIWFLTAVKRYVYLQYTGFYMLCIYSVFGTPDPRSSEIPDRYGSVCILVQVIVDPCHVHTYRDCL